MLYEVITLSLAQNDQGYAETVAWWRGVIQTLQPYRLQLQNMEALKSYQMIGRYGFYEALDFTSYNFV